MPGPPPHWRPAGALYSEALAFAGRSASPGLQTKSRSDNAVTLSEFSS
jgi:hypothetical protein